MNTQECTACGVHFSVVFDEDADVRFCPSCGEEQIEELEFGGEYYDYMD